MIEMRIQSITRMAVLTLLLFLLWACRKGEGAICNDGWRSHSTGSGTCSWHGGVHHYIDPEEIDVWNTSLLIILIIGGIWLIRILGKNSK